MDYRLFDSVRRQASPVEVELVEAFAQGQISRRAFVARGSMIGLGMPLIGAILAACGSDNKGTSGGYHPFGRHHPYGRHHGPGRHDSRRTDQAGRHVAHRCADTSRSTRSGRHGRPRYLHTGGHVLRLSGRRPRRRRHADARRDVEAQRRRQRVDLQPPQGREVARRHAVHLCRRGRHHGPLGRQQPEGVHRRRLHEGHRRLHGRDHTPQPRWSVPSAGRCVQPAIGYHPQGLRARHDARQAPDRHRCVQAHQVRRGHRRHVRGEPGLVGWQAVPRQARVQLQRRPRHAGVRSAGRRGRCDHAVLGGRWRRAAQRQQHHRRDHPRCGAPSRSG